MTNNFIAVSSEEGNKNLKSRNEGWEVFQLDCMDICQNLVSFVEMRTLFWNYKLISLNLVAKLLF